MFFDNVSQIQSIAKKCGTSIFVLPDDIEVDIPHMIALSPDVKTVITIEQVREVLALVSTRQTEDRFIVIRPAEALGEAAANALLKNLEEPGDMVHFVLIVKDPSCLLPTILSRAQMFFLKSSSSLEAGLSCDDKVRDLAKELMVAKPSGLVQVVEKITKKKDGVRSYALEVVGTAIEMLYKTYFLTEKDVFLKKLPKFLAAYDGISRNGHVKLQIIANLC